MKANLLLVNVLIVALASAHDNSPDKLRVENCVPEYAPAARTAALATENFTVRPVSAINRENTYNLYTEKSEAVVKGNGIAEDEDSGSTLYIPNSFTPNNDGLNDLFLIYGSGVKNYKLNIYSRWGDLLFSGDENSKGWNGCFKGNPCDQATYVYIIEYETLAGDKIRKAGHVTLVR